MSKKTEGIADFLCNGLEHCTDEQEPLLYLTQEFELSEAQAKRMITLGYKVMIQPAMTNDELFPLIEEALKGA